MPLVQDLLRTDQIDNKDGCNNKTNVAMLQNELAIYIHVHVCI